MTIQQSIRAARPLALACLSLALLAAAPAARAQPASAPAPVRSEAEREQEIQRLEAEIARRIAEEQGPRRGYVTPSTRSAEYAAYYLRFATRIECAAEKNYPPAAKGRTLKSIATVSVLADGSVEKVEIDRSSGVAEVDAAIAAVVRAAAPFDSFSGTMRKSYYVLDITSAWTFSPDHDKSKDDPDCGRLMERSRKQ